MNLRLVWLLFAAAVGAGAPAAAIPRACATPRTAAFPFCNASLPTEARIRDLVQRLTSEEKLQMMTARRSPLGGVPRLGVPEYDWGGNCVHGVQSRCGSNGTRCPTSFPNPNGLGASFNFTAWRTMGAIIGRELRSLWLQNVGEDHGSGLPHMGLDCWSPNVGIARDMRWGRNMETPGEDPLVNGLYGAAYALGMQQPDGTGVVQAIATLKHFAANSLEGNWSSPRCPDGLCTRHSIDANISAYDLASTYYPPFRTSVEMGGALGAMCSYNAINGVPSCANGPLLDGRLRGKWGFQGYVTSDSGAVQDIYEAHRYANATRAVAEAVKAGCDLNSGGWSGDHAWSTSSPYMRHLPQALEEGLVRAADVDRALATLLRMRFRLGLFDPIERQPYWHVAPEVVRSPEHTAAALDATLQSLVLLRNRARVLPLRAPGSSHGRGTAVRSVAVIGPHARAGRALIGNYYGEVCPGETFDCVQTPYDAVRQHMAGRGTVAYAPGLASVSDTSRRQFAHALATAQACDVVVLLLGLDDTIEAEALDRHSVTLPGAQLELARLLISASGTPVITVLINGGMVAIDWLATHSDTLIEAYYPGFYGAKALTQLLFGEANRWGKLTTTIHGDRYTAEFDMLNFEMARAPGRTYRYYTGTPLFAFGTGLSYTTFALTLDTDVGVGHAEGAQPDRDPHGGAVGAGRGAGGVVRHISNDPAAPTATTFRVRVTNVGDMAGDEVVQAYFTPLSLAPDTQASRLQRQLFNFTRVSLDPGASTAVSFAVSPATLMVFSDGGDGVSVPGQYRLQFTNGAGQVLNATVVVRGDGAVVLDRF